MEFFSLFQKCTLCPRECGVDRTGEDSAARLGFCGMSHRLRVAYVGPHFGEEPPISGTRGSGTVFFSGCTLRCSYCQNYQISRKGLGEEMTLRALLGRVRKMISGDRVHNINWVTPDHFFPHVFSLVSCLRKEGCTLPMVYNLSGYQSRAMLKRAEDYADIYLPDFKYADQALSRRLSSCGDYTGKALEAISEMIRQKGFLDATRTGASPASRGVLVRHLILPGHIENSLAALTSLFLEFGPRLPLSLMSQYTPARPQRDDALNRSITLNEFDRVYRHTLDLGFEQMFVQFPTSEGTGEKRPSPFMPDFRLAKPFSGIRGA